MSLIDFVCENCVAVSCSCKEIFMSSRAGRGLEMCETLIKKVISKRTLIRIGEVLGSHLYLAGTDITSCL